MSRLHIYHTLKFFFFFFVFSMDWLSSHRYVHVIPRYGQRLYNENQYVRSHSGYGQSDGAGKGPDHSGRRMRRLLYTRREHNRTCEYTASITQYNWTKNCRTPIKLEFLICYLCRLQFCRWKMNRQIRLNDVFFFFFVIQRCIWI